MNIKRPYKIFFVRYRCAKCLHAPIRVKKKKKRMNEWQKNICIFDTYTNTRADCEQVRTTDDHYLLWCRWWNVTNCIPIRFVHLLKCHKTDFFFFFFFHIFILFLNWMNVMSIFFSSKRRANCHIHSHLYKQSMCEYVSLISLL